MHANLAMLPVIDAAAMKNWDESSFLSRWTFSLATPLVQLGDTRPLEIDDLIRLSEKDKCGNMAGRVKAAYASSRSIFFFPRILVALWRAFWWDCTVCGFYSLVEGATRVASPVILAFLLHELQSPDSPAWRAYMWGTVMCVLNLLQVVVHHVLFLISMRNGWNFKNSTTALIFDNLMMVRNSALESAGMSTGKLVNLLSNDVARYEEFSVVSLHVFVLSSFALFLPYIYLLTYCCFVCFL